jgi:Uma2 family endonuclease
MNKNTFCPLCPDFVVELRSPSDTLQTLQRKMREYWDNGERLGWLIDPQTCTVEMYRQGQGEKTLENPATVSGKDVLPGMCTRYDEGVGVSDYGRALRTSFMS